MTTAFTFTPTTLIVLEGIVPCQVCRVQLPAEVEADDAIVRLERGGEQYTWQGNQLTGDLLVPEITTSTEGVAHLTVGSQTWSQAISFGPVRRWTVCLVNHSHTDIGFTHPYLECIDIHVKNLRLALELVDQTGHWPDATRFRWTVESAWQLQHYLRRYPEDRERLARAVRAGFIEVEALYIHSYFDILSSQQLVHSLAFAEAARQELGIPITSAMICDVPGCAWSLVDLFAQAGVQYLSMAINNFIAPFHAQTNLPRPFVWEGPAGGRVTTWYGGDPTWAYIEGARLGFWDSIEAVSNRLPARLSELEADAYPYDIVQIQVSSDSRPLRLLPATIAREWNARYLSPTIEITTPSAFYEQIKARFGETFPVVSGEWQSSWSETSLHYPHEAALSRRNHHTLNQWERFSVIADWMNEGWIPLVTALDDAFDASLLFDEHGGEKGIWLPHSAQEAEDALIQGFSLFEAETGPARSGLETAIASATRAQATNDDPVAVVWNTCAWTRGGAVKINTIAHAAIDEATGESVPVVPGQDGSTLLYASDVPAVGFRRYRLLKAPSESSIWPEPAAAAIRTDKGALLENQRLRVDMDGEGRITSVTDQDDGREYIDGKEWLGANTFARYRTDPAGPELGGDFTSDRRLYDGIPINGWVEAATSTITSEITTGVEAGEAWAETLTEVDGLYRWATRITLHPERIDIRDRITWLGQPDQPEMLYVVFPFAFRNPELRHAVQFAVVDPRRQTLSGSNHDYFAIQNWVDVADDAAGVTMTSADLPLVDYGGINLRKFQTAVTPEHGVLAFRAAALAVMPQAEGTPWGQFPWLELQFSIIPRVGALDLIAAHRLGEEHVSPLTAHVLPPRCPGEWRQSSASLVRIDSDTVMLDGLKPAREGGVLIRLREVVGRRSAAQLSFPEHQLVSARRTSPNGYDGKLIAIRDNAITLELGPFEHTTLYCHMGR